MVAPVVAAAALGGTASLAGSMFSAHSSAKAADRAVKRQIAWERERATHAHQWEVQDLTKAGLNPVLSAGGSGAVTGGISAPVPDTSGYQTAGAAIGEGINTAAGLARTQAEIGKMGSEVKNINQDTENKNKQGALIDAQTIVEQYKAGLISAQAAKTELENVKLKFENDHQKLTYWNNFMNTASGTAANVVKAGEGVVNAVTKGLIPKGDKGYKEFQEIGKGWKSTTREYF